MNRTLAAAACLVLTLSACAHGPPDRGPRGRGGPDGFGGPGLRPGRPGGPGGAAGPREQLFISPAGEPFRAPPGQPYPLALWWTRMDPAETGQVTAAVLTADFERFFAVADLDHNGSIDGFEVTAYETKTVPEILQGAGGGGLQGAAAYGLLNDPEPLRSADANLDGQVTLAEYRRKAADVFTRLDKDHNGQLARAELPPPPKPGANAGHPRGGPDAGAAGRGGGRGGRGGGGGGGGRGPR